MQDDKLRPTPLDEQALMDRILSRPESRKKRAPALPSGEATSFIGAVRRRLEEAAADLEEGSGLSVLLVLPSGERLQVQRISSRKPDLVMLQCLDATGEALEILSHEQAVQLQVRVSRPGSLAGPESACIVSDGEGD